MRTAYTGAATLVAIAALTAHIGAAPLDIKAGYKERWAYAMAGKSIGSLSAECTAVRGADKRGQLDWKYDLNLAIPAQGSTVKLAMTGTFTVTSDGIPVAMTINADVSGGRQNLKVRFGSGKATISGTANGQAIQKDAAIAGNEFLSVNNLMTLYSLATRVLRPAPGKTLTAPFFPIEMMQKLDVKFVARAKTETIKVGGKSVECVVCDVSPMQGRVHIVRETGEMVRFAVDAQQLVITRE